MQRVRIGLTGLAFVFLAVLLAAVFTAPARPTRPRSPRTRSSSSKRAPFRPPRRRRSRPADPLATMKLTPGNSDVNAAAPQQSPPAAARNQPAQR